MEFYPKYPRREQYDLNGMWDFTFVPDLEHPTRPDFDQFAFADQMPVPGVFDIYPDSMAARGTGFYRKIVNISTAGEVLLKLAGLGLWAAVFWDKHFIGSIDLPYSGCELKFKSGPTGKHELIIAVDNRFDQQRTPLFSQYYDFYGHGGIYRPVELHILPKKAFDRIHVSTADYTCGKVKIAIRFHEDIQETGDLLYAFDDGDFHLVPEAEFEVEVPDFKLWAPSAPFLHTITVKSETDCIIEQFGIRCIRAGDNQIWLNGESIKLRGFCRHEAHPQFGSALPLNIIMEDIRWLKDLNCNFIRGVHYPQDQRFLSLCDQFGLLVWEEALGWGDHQDHLTDPAFQDAQLRQLKLMVKNSFNHPCVIIWGFLNEGDSHLEYAVPFYGEMIRCLRQQDSSRLVTYASARGETDLNYAAADIVCLNTYPAWYSADSEKFRPLGEIRTRLDRFLEFMKNNKLSDKPFIISEIGAGAIYGWRDRFRVHWSEEYQADYLEEVCRYIEETPAVTGVAFWHFADCRTYSSSRALYRPRAFNNKGIMDEYRRPKLAYEVVKQYFVDKLNDRGEK